jgi:hypothetical protein
LSWEAVVLQQRGGSCPSRHGGTVLAAACGGLALACLFAEEKGFGEAGQGGWDGPVNNRRVRCGTPGRL